MLPDKDCDGKTLLPFGNGRSYGDVCLNNGGVLIDARTLNRFIHFDVEAGIIRCESGVLLSDILELIVPKGWFLPVTPGTRFITIGGAIANDVHGKNHHRAGTFGCHLRCFELLRSDGSRLLCSADDNTDWYRATIGGLGLTGLITWAEIKLKLMSTTSIDQETIRYSNLDEYFDLSSESDKGYEYTVAWLDCLAKGKNLGRGIFIRANHADKISGKVPEMPKLKFAIPVALPLSLVNHWSLKLFNSLYYHKQWQTRKTTTLHYAPFFYPLDSIQGWNRIYGPKGFLQYQCVLPHEQGSEAIKEILGRISSAGTGSFLAVMKIFGKKLSPGLMSFPRPGITLALDFPNQGEKTFKLLDQLDEVTSAANGAVYPAKDARVSPEFFQSSFPEWKEFMHFIDLRFSSSLWRRVSGTGL